MLSKTNTQRLFVLQKYTGYNINEVQIHENEKEPHKSFVFLFEPSFLWFKKRYRMLLSEFELVLNSVHLSPDELIFCKSLDEVKL